MKPLGFSRRFFKPFVGGSLLAGLLLQTPAFAQYSEPNTEPPALDSKTIAVLPKPGPAGAALAEKQPAPTQMASEPIARALPAPTLEPGEEGLVISLPAALRLTNAGAWDITIASQQLRVAAAQLQGANVLWLPTMVAGVDYQYHSGPVQAVDGSVSNISHSNMYAGGAPLAIFALTDAIFTPLSARQIVRAQGANVQTARNDTLTDMAQIYFQLLEAEADLASIMDVDRRATELVTKAESLAPGLIPDVELARVRAAKANIEQVVETARQRWRSASAGVARIARLKPTVVLQPLEPPHMRVNLVPPARTPEELIPIALATRPELTFQDALAQAARERVRQEQWRPFLPTFIGRGGGTVPPYPMAYGGYAAGQGTDLGGFNQRSDWDVSAIWTVQNLGLGNVALVRQRRSELDVARSQEFRFRDVVAQEVTVAWADLRSAERRIGQTERELRQAEISARENLEGLGEVKRVAGGINILVIRPLEVVVALQALNQAYFDYYGVIAEYNRAQFRMYRALGNPAQLLEGHDGLGGPQLAATGPGAPAPLNLGAPIRP
jgi:outer membrane protein TolC